MEQTFGAPTETVVRIPLERITESINNPRKTYSEEDLQEMAGSIASQGVLQPIVVRELTGSVFAYEIVFGHRRFRGSTRAGKDDIPAIVRQMTDEQADQARLHENLEREDVHYIEEAESMHRLMTEYGVTAADLVEQTGKKLTFVYGRLKLASLHPKVREACLAGIFTAEIATMIARWPLAVQPKAMAVCIQDFYGMSPEDKGRHAKSYRECKAALRGLAIPIARADFAHADATLPGPDGHPKACAYCSNNTVNDAALSEHFGPEAQCLFRECYDKRAAEQGRRTVEQARADGRVVDAEVAASQPDLVSEHQWLGGAGGYVRNLLEIAQAEGLTAPEPTLVLRGDEVVGKRYSKAAIESLKATLFPESVKAAGAADADADEPELSLEDLPPEQRTMADHGSWLRVRAALLKAARHAPRTGDELRMVLLEILDSAGEFHEAAELAMGWPADLGELDDPDEERRALLAGMSDGDLAALLVLDTLCQRTGHIHLRHPDFTARMADQLELAHRYGVDVLQAAQPPAAPPPADPQPGSASSEVRTPVPLPATSKGAGAAKYRNSHTGDTWSGRGLKPKWLQAALAAGRTLAEFEVGGAVNQSDDGRVAAGSVAEAAA